MDELNFQSGKDTLSHMLRVNAQLVADNKAISDQVDALRTENAALTAGAKELRGQLAISKNQVDEYERMFELLERTGKALCDKATGGGE